MDSPGASARSRAPDGARVHARIRRPVGRVLPLALRSRWTPAAEHRLLQERVKRDGRSVDSHPGLLGRGRGLHPSGLLPESPQARDARVAAIPLAADLRCDPLSCRSHHRSALAALPRRARAPGRGVEHGPRERRGSGNPSVPRRLPPSRAREDCAVCRGGHAGAEPVVAPRRRGDRARLRDPSRPRSGLAQERDATRLRP